MSSWLATGSIMPSDIGICRMFAWYRESRGRVAPILRCHGIASRLVMLVASAEPAPSSLLGFAPAPNISKAAAQHDLASMLALNSRPVRNKTLQIPRSPTPERAGHRTNARAGDLTPSSVPLAPRHG